MRVLSCAVSGNKLHNVASCREQEGVDQTYPFAQNSDKCLHYNLQGKQRASGSS